VLRQRWLKKGVGGYKVVAKKNLLPHSLPHNLANTGERAADEIGQVKAQKAIHGHEEAGAIVVFVAELLGVSPW
jgi:hypothetical protein